MKIIIIVFIFLLGLMFCLKYKHSDLVEGFANNGGCPNLLVQKGNHQYNHDDVSLYLLDF